MRPRITPYGSINEASVIHEYISLVIYPHQFLRPVINDYVETRLAEGASVTTVRLELSAIRGLFHFMMDMNASDVMFNPAKGVKVKTATSLGKTRTLASVAQTVEQQAEGEK